jgi:membrane fusion protein (multidrug efflux system)
MSFLKPARPRLILGFLAIAILGAACSRQSGPPQGPPAVPVTVVTLKAQKVTLTRELPGRVSALLTAEVRPQVDGIIRERLFTEGGPVKAGQPLYQIDDATYRADHESAKASLLRARASLNTAQLRAKRLTELLAANVVSKQDYDDAIAAEQQAQADVTAAQAAVNRTGVILGYALIRSPITGIIGRSSVTAGALVTAKQNDPLATVQQLDPSYVDVTQSSAELLALRKELADRQAQDARDLPVTIVLEDGSRYPQPGTLEFSEVTVETTTGSYAMRILVPNPDHLLMPGMYVRALIGSTVREDAVLVPQQAVLRSPNGDSYCMVVDKDNKVEQHTMHVQRAVGDQWLVEDGLAAGDRVVVEGLQKIRSGAMVQPTEAGSAPATAPGTPQH